MPCCFDKAISVSASTVRRGQDRLGSVLASYAVRVSGRYRILRENTVSRKYLRGGVESQKRVRYCWPTPFKVLGVLFLGEVPSAFLPSKKACWAHRFRYLGVGQQYLPVYPIQSSALITASATFGHSALPDTVTYRHIMALQ